MDISFASKKLASQLSDEEQIRRAFGERGRRLMLRLDLLRAASCLADVPHTPPTRRHALRGKWAGHYAVDITANWRLIFWPLETSSPANLGGAGDLAAITAIEVVAIEDYH
jgi:plasmid maintenance system killer protein